MGARPWAKEYAAVAAAALLSHLTALAAGFVWLDHAHIEQRYALAEPGRWLALFTDGFARTGFYRPLMSAALSIDALLGGGPITFHATSLLWHAAASVAAAAAGKALGLERRAAIFAAVLFAVHPLTGLVADAIAFRSEAMVATFLLGLLWAHASGRALLSAAFLFAACLTKEIGYVLGPLFVAVLHVSKTTEPTKDLRRLLGAEAVALAAAAALHLAFAPSFRASHPPLDPSAAIGTRAAALAKSAAAMVLPIDRHVCDAFRIVPIHHPASIAGLAFASTAAWLAWKRRGVAMLFALALLPSLQLVPAMRWWSPHYLYVPAAFGAMLVGELVERRGGRTRAVAGAAVVVLGIVSVVDGRRYASDVTLFAPEAAAEPACREAQFYLGELDREARRWDAAAERYEAALVPRPGILAYVDRGAALQNLGAVRLEQHRFAEARAIFLSALDGAKDPTSRRELLHDAAAAALQAGDPAEADRLLAAETARPDALAESLLVRAIALSRLGRPAEAEPLFARAKRARGR